MIKTKKVSSHMVKNKELLHFTAKYTQIKSKILAHKPLGGALSFKYEQSIQGWDKAYWFYK